MAGSIHTAPAMRRVVDDLVDQADQVVVGPQHVARGHVHVGERGEAAEAR